MDCRGEAKIGVKYCGNCNPQLNGPELVQELRKLNPALNFTNYSDEGIDLLLIVSGCSADCATRPDFSGETIVVGGHYLDCFPIEPSQLPAAVSQKLQAKLGSKEKIN